MKGGAEHHQRRMLTAAGATRTLRAHLVQLCGHLEASARALELEAEPGAKPTLTRPILEASIASMSGAIDGLCSAREAMRFLAESLST